MAAGPVIVVAVGFDLPEQMLDDLRAVAPRVEVRHVPYVETEELRSVRKLHRGGNPDGVPVPELSAADRAAWGDAEIAIVWDVPDDIGSLAPELRWIQTINAGVDKYDLEAFAAARIQLTNGSGVGAVSIAEFVFARVLQIYKNLRLFDEQQSEQLWKGRFGPEVAGQTLAVVGLGAIGRQVARRARAFEMEVLASRASATPGDSDPDADELFGPDGLDAMLSRADVVVATLPHTDDTSDLFDGSRFAAMKPGAIFCNVSRGSLVVEKALIEALGSGHLAAAALDVTRQEPLPPGDPLWDAPNLYLSPHSSVSVDRYAERVAKLVVENLHRYLTGDELGPAVRDIERHQRCFDA